MKSASPIAFAFALALVLCSPVSALDTRSGTRIFYTSNAMAEIISPGGLRVLIDVYRPSLLSSPAKDSDILLTTHTHPDHWNGVFKREFPGKQLFDQTGIIQQGDLRITGIASSHSDTESGPESGGSNYFFLIETGGLRIAHLGDVGQSKLTGAQLEALGKVDVLITQFDNGYSDMGAQNGKGFNLVGQIKPALVLPTHNSDAALRRQSTEYSCVFSPKPYVTISPDLLREEGERAGKPLMLVIGDGYAKRAATCQAAGADW